MSVDRIGAVRRSLYPLAWGGCAAAALVALPLLATYLFLEVSNRPAIAFEEAARGSLHPASLFTAVVSDLYGIINPRMSYWGPYSEWWDKNELTLSDNMSQLYFGSLPMLLVLTVGLIRGHLWNREIRVLAIAIAVLLLYALGKFTPAFGVFFDYLPGVGFFRRPVDATFLLGALLAIVVGYFVHLWASSSLSTVSRRVKSIEAAALFSVLLAALTVAWSAGRLADAWMPVGIALAWMTAAWLLLSIPPAYLKRAPGFVVAGPVLLLAIDLAVNNGPNTSTALPPATYDMLKPSCKNETVRFLKERLRREAGSAWRDRVELAGLGFEWQNVALVHGFEGTLGYNPFRLGELSQATGAHDYIAGPDQKTFSRLFPSYASPMANLLGLRFIAVGVPIEQVDRALKPGDLKLVARTPEAYIYENPNALPRVLFVADWRPADFAWLIATGRWPAFDPRQTVLLDQTPEFDREIVSLARYTSATPGVRIRHYENTKVVIDVDATRSGFVVLHDLWHPWWVAEIDGLETTVLRANVLFRAVEVPAGRHVLTFEFRPIDGAISDASDRLLDTLGMNAWFSARGVRDGTPTRH